ncbi:MAG: putative glycoside hydrolase [Chloroflexota bacterium]
MNRRLLAALFALLLAALACGESVTATISPAPEASSVDPGQNEGMDDKTPRLALWLAKKNDLIANPQAKYDLVMTAWFTPQEADTLTSRNPPSMLLGGLSHTWIWDDPTWLTFLLTIANQGDPNGVLQITEDMYLMFDEDGDGSPERRCSAPGWEGIYAMDPRHPKWRELILAFYQTVATQAQHDGVIVDMLDAYPFCEGAHSLGVPTPLDTQGWVSAQEELLALIRENTPPEKWVFANAGKGFDDDSPFPQYLNGYLLENFLGAWGAGLEEGLQSAERALVATQAPHIVVFAVDTDDTGNVDWNRFRVGLVASMLMDNTYFAFDSGARDHGSVTNWWFPEYYDIALGEPLGAYSVENGNYRRDFEQGVVVIAQQNAMQLIFDTEHRDIFSGNTGTQFQVSQGDARIFVLRARP